MNTLLTHRVGILGFAIIVSGCVKQPTVQPDTTTYPRDKVTVVHGALPVAPPIVLKNNLNIAVFGEPVYQSRSERSHSINYEFSTETIGDTAETEVYVKPRRRGRASLNKLLPLVKAKVKTICANDYRVVKTTYYNGTEGTAQLLGIESSFVKVAVRCPVYDPAGPSNEYSYIRKLGAVLKDANYFDVLTKKYDIPPNRMKAVLKTAVVKFGLVVSEENTDEKSWYLIAGKKSNNSYPSVLPRLVASIVSVGGQSQLSFIRTGFKFNCHAQALKKQENRCEKPGNTPWHGSLVPSDRKHSYWNARRFLQQVEDVISGK